MSANVLARAARRIGCGALGLVAVWGAWTSTPVRPAGRLMHVSAPARAEGRALFLHEWTPHDPLARGDGLGPVFNGRSCVACHAQGGVGGGGGVGQNVVAFEAFPTRVPGRVLGGMIHKFAVDPRDRETGRVLRASFPVIPGGVHARDADPVRVETINSTALFGAGRIDLISGDSILARRGRRRFEQLRREAGGTVRGAALGRPRVLADGRVGKFGWKAQFATLEEFVAAACANELGLGNPLADQAAPLGRPAAPKGERDLGTGEFLSLVAYIGTLPRPISVLPPDPPGRREAERGRALFEQVGCVDCHEPEVGGLAGVYSDFLLHALEDQSSGGGSYGGGRESPHPPLPQDHPAAEEWRTPPLWGVADSAPYFHDGASPTLESAILRHQGDAADSTRAYQALPEPDRASLIRFLKTLRAPADAEPAPSETKGQLVLLR